MERTEQLNAIWSLLQTLRRQEFEEWQAAETGISDLRSDENRRRAVALRIKQTTIKETAQACGFTREELT